MCYLTWRKTLWSVIKWRILSWGDYLDCSSESSVIRRIVLSERGATGEGQLWFHTRSVSVTLILVFCLCLIHNALPWGILLQLCLTLKPKCLCSPHREISWPCPLVKDILNFLVRRMVLLPMCCLPAWLRNSHFGGARITDSCGHFTPPVKCQ